MEKRLGVFQCLRLAKVKHFIILKKEANQKITQTKQCSIKAFASDSSALNKNAIKAFLGGALIYIYLSLKDDAKAVGTYACPHKRPVLRASLKLIIHFLLKMSFFANVHFTLSNN